MTKNMKESKESANNVDFNMPSKSKLAQCTEEDPDDYDPSQHRDMVDGLGTLGALFHMIKGSLGSGILAMPMAFKNAGLWVGLLGAILIGFLVTHCVYLLALCSQKLAKRVKRTSLGFSDTMEAAFLTGPKNWRKFATPARELVNISLVITYYTGDTVYIVFIATSFKQVIDKSLGIDLNIRLYILILTAILIPLGCIRKLRFLVPLSLVAIVLLMFGCGFVLFDMFSALPPFDSRPVFSSWKRFPLFYSTMCFAIEGIGTVLPIENTMKKPHYFLGCPGVLNTAMVWLVVTYTTVGFFGYLRYGDETRGSITLNLAYSFLGETVKILVGLNVLLSYPLLLYVCCEGVWKYLEPRVSKTNETLYYYSMRVILVLGTILLASALPNLEPFMGLVGSICFSTLGLLFPAVLELVTFWEDRDYMCRWRYYKNILIMLGWVVALITGVKASVETIIDIYWPS